MSCAKCDQPVIQRSKYCEQHRSGKRCAQPDCLKSAIPPTEFCIEHGGGKRCAQLDCLKSAQGQTEFCVEHGGGKRCPHCIDWIDSRCGQREYDGYCATCFKRLFPSDPRSTRVYAHSKEIRVRNAIAERATVDSRFAGFIDDRPMYTGQCDCTHKRRVDHRKLVGNTILAVETDEFSHRGYDEKDEEIRYDDLYMIHSGKWIYIRFNPDPSRSCDTDLEDRISVLLDTIEEQIRRTEEERNEDLVEIIKLFYR